MTLSVSLPVDAGPRQRRSPAAVLRETLAAYAAADGLLDEVRILPDQRTWARVHATPDLELWLLAWPSGARTDWHDHGSSRGAFTVLRGSLVEHTWDGSLRLRPLDAGDTREFGAGYVHDVRNTSRDVAVSLHAYSPRLELMNRYAFRGDRMELLGVECAGEW